MDPRLDSFAGTFPQVYGFYHGIYDTVMGAAKHTDPTGGYVANAVDGAVAPHLSTAYQAAVDAAPVGARTAYYSSAMVDILAITHGVGTASRTVVAAAPKTQLARGAGSGPYCFAGDTEIQAPTPSRIDSIRPGDRVLAAASTDGGGEAWVQVESSAEGKMAAWSPRGGCARLARAGQRAVPPAILAACELETAAAERPSDVAVVQVYDARTGAWYKDVGAELEVGDTFVDDGRVLRVTEAGVEERGEAGFEDLANADATWAAGAARRMPEGDDWVLVLGDGDDAGHWQLSKVAPGERFAFQGRVFDTDDADADGHLEVRASELVVSRVVQTFERQSDTVIDAEILYEDGSVEVLTGTPEHPFYVPALNEWLPLGELAEDTELHVESGAGAILIGKTWRQGDFTVYNFEVENQHNYLVRAPESASAAVLVHNSCLVNLGMKMFSSNGGRTGMIAETVTKRGDNLIFENFTIASEHGGRDLVGPMRELLAFAKEQGAKTLTFKGEFINPELARRLGMDADKPFEVVVEATREGLSSALRGGQ